MDLDASSDQESLDCQQMSIESNSRERTDRLKNGVVKGHLAFKVTLDDSQADLLGRLDVAIADIRIVWVTGSAALLSIEIDGDALLSDCNRGPSMH